MTREEKCQIAIEKGFTYNPETGKVFGIYGKEIKTTEKGYIRLNFYLNKKLYGLKVHQFAWYWINKECVSFIDHINGQRNDNRFCNLRSVTNQENLFNTKAKGYFYNKKNNKFIAQICLNGKRINLGAFLNKEDASAAYLEAKNEYHKII